MIECSKPLGSRIVDFNALVGSGMKYGFGPHRVLFFFDDAAVISLFVCKHV